MTALALGGIRRKSAIRLGPLVERILGMILLALAAIWLGWNLVADSHRFTGSVLIGLQNGLLYALVALGYTMVYGIIELINFAHGDLFMLATIVAAAVMVTFSGSGSSERGQHPAAACRAGRLHGVRRRRQRVAPSASPTGRLRSAPKLAPLMTAVGLSFVFRGIAQQDYINGSAQKNWPVDWGGPIVEGVFVYKL